MGVSAIPRCGTGMACYPINYLTKAIIYSDFVQSHIGPAGYFRDVTQMNKYIKKSKFLPDLNNERDF